MRSSLDSEAAEGYDPLTLPDAISMALNARCCVTNWVFDELVLDTLLGKTSRLRISRYYWNLEPPVAVDFIKNIRFGEAEYALKKHFFHQHNIIYVLARDEWDGTSVDKALLAHAPVDEQVQAIIEAGRPLFAPRRKSVHSER